MNELLCHLFGDYVFQNHAMALRKTVSTPWAAFHALVYTIPFICITREPAAISIIMVTHMIIDRQRLAKYWVRFYGVGQTGWICERFGMKIDDAPVWLATWLLIIVDNTIHLTINHFALMI
jgi:hypothetical protein